MGITGILRVNINVDACGDSVIFNTLDKYKLQFFYKEMSGQVD